MRILVIDDDSNVSDFLKAALHSASYAVDASATGEDALHMAAVVDYDLILLDLVLPGMHGLEVLKKLRASKDQTPVIIVSGLVSFEDRAKGLDLGADDYITKPFSIIELLARVRVCLRRGKREQELVMHVADLEMDRTNRAVRRNRKRIDLSPKEFAVLEFLLLNKERTLTAEVIYEHVWNWGENPLTNVVPVYINYLRNKVDNGFAPKLIHTVRGVGYRLGAPESENGDDAA